MRPSVQLLNQARNQAQSEILDFTAFDFAHDAELFVGRDSKAGRRSSSYKRFDTAAQAIQYYIEMLPIASHAGAHLEVNETRFSQSEVRRLYDSPSFPLPRRSDSTQ